MKKKNGISDDLLDSYIAQIPEDIIQNLYVKKCLTSYEGFALVPKDNWKYDMCLQAARGESINKDLSVLVKPDLDAYDLSQNPIRGNIDTCVLLPCGEALNMAVDWDIVDYAVSNGALVKPHPETSDEFIRTLISSYGKSVLDKSISAYVLIEKCSKVYVSSFSETSLYAILGDTKRVYSLDYYYSGSYANLIKKSLRKKDMLNAILNSPKSGIFITRFPELSSQQRLQHFIKFYSRL